MLDRLTGALADRYRLEEELGKGGMATVYLAHDVRHDRKVAVKVLRPELAAVIGAARFLAEIKTTANLQHPHILPLHDSGEVDGTVFYVMPYVEGESLRDRLTREKQLPVDDAVRIAVEVAGALEYAHQHKVIHRDMKPENILLHGGHALVADFGIALAVSRSDGGTRMTETGMSLGTPHYMSPEQAMGEREITARSDVYALGCVLYETLTGEPPFTGPTAQAIVARVMTEEPRSLTLQRRTIPHHVEAAVHRALSKLPADRFTSAADFAAALQNPAFAATVSAAGHPRSIAPLLRPSAAVLGLAAIAIVATALAAWGWLRPEPPRPVARFTVTFPEGQERISGFGPDIVLAPDGSFLVYRGPGSTAGGQFYRRPIDRLSGTPIPGTETSQGPAVSPDGRMVAFGTPSGLRLVALDGGPPVTLTDSGGVNPSWGPGGWIYFQLRGGLARIAATGGPIEQVTTVDTGGVLNQQRFPDVLPNGRGVLFTIWRGSLTDADIAVADRAGAVRVLLRGTRARYAASGHVVYTRADGALLAVPFDAEKLTLTGPSTPLLEGVLVEPGGSAEFSMARNGTLVYLSGQATTRQMVWVDRSGAEVPVDSDQGRDFGFPAVSPDGSRIAVSVNTGAELNVWIYHLVQKTLSRLTFEGTSNNYPFWSPDGKRVGFQSARGGPASLYEMPADGSGPATLLVPHGGRPVQEGVWLPDGRTLVFRVGPGGATLRDLYYTRPGVDSAATTILETPFDETAPTLSPDGRWLAYQSNESGRQEIYVRPFPGPGGRWQVSVGGGTQPRWSRAGREIFYTAAGNLVAAEVATQPTFSVGAQRILFPTRGYAENEGHPQYDASPDGRRFLFLKQSGGEAHQVIVLNWFEELKARVGR